MKRTCGAATYLGNGDDLCTLWDFWWMDAAEMIEQHAIYVPGSVIFYCRRYESDSISPMSASTSRPTSSPTSRPASSPSTLPSSSPTTMPFTFPTSPSSPPSSPTTTPSSSPTTSPSSPHTFRPSTAPTSSPSSLPTSTSSTSPNFISISSTETCPEGYLSIESLEACESAATYFEKEWYGLDLDTRFPRGCFYYDTGTDQYGGSVYLNNAEFSTSVRTVDEFYCMKVESTKVCQVASDDIFPVYCDFPFSYDGKLYYDCITNDFTGQPRCATLADPQNYSVTTWGYCDCTSNQDDDHSYNMTGIFMAEAGYCPSRYMYIETYHECELAAIALNLNDIQVESISNILRPYN